MDVNLFDVPQTVFENEYVLLQELFLKGDDLQKLSVIQALPQLLQYDPNGTLTRLVPKIQQELPKSSCEFHIATSKIFKLLIEKELPLNLTGAVLQGTESKDPVVSNAWIETLLAVIPILPIDQIKTSVIPLALSKSLPSSPVYNRVSSCKIFGKCAAHPQMQSIDVKTLILPPVQSLCQDCFQDVRATMCSQLHLIAQGLGENFVKVSLLPSLVELASDDNMAVRSAAVASSVLIIPYLNKQTKIETIVPLIKQLCSKTGGANDATYPTIAREFGKLVQALQNDIDVNDCVWILQFYHTLATKGQAVRINKDNMEVTQDIVCREQCAYNLPAVTFFTVARISNQLDLWHSVFSKLANDSCYLVRKTTAGCVHEVARILGPQCKVIKDDIVKLLRDDAEEVLHMLIPHVGTTLELLGANGVLSREANIPTCLEVAKALLKCHMEMSKCFNWRVRSNLLEQMESLPGCMPSDFIHQHFTPVLLNCVLDARPKPVRSQASRTLLVFLRYNLKEVQRKWIRDNLISQLCYSKSCYTRHIFILACEHAAHIFSNAYFKKHFFEPLLSLSDDPICNIRISLVGLLPLVYRMLVMPDDRKLQQNIDNIFSKLDMVEKDRDVKDILRTKLREIRSPGITNKPDYILDQKRKEEEETKISQGKLVPLAPVAHVDYGTHQALSGPKDANNRSQQPIISRTNSTPSRTVKSPSASSTGSPSDMSFLEQHFYIDAGVSLPRDNIAINTHDSINIDVCKVSEDLDRQINLAPIEESRNDQSVATVSVENVNIETLSEHELKKLETSTTNITDDVKVNLRKRNKRTSNRASTSKSSVSPPKETTSSVNSRYKRYSSVFPRSSAEGIRATTDAKVSNRRSLNMGSGDNSRIPVCIKKSQSNTEIKNECDINTNRELKSSGAIKKSELEHDKNKVRPKSEILKSSNSNWIPVIKSYTRGALETHNTAIDVSIMENNVPVTSNRISKTSGLPVLKRRAYSDNKK